MEGRSRRDESVTGGERRGGQDSIAKLEMARLRDEDKEVGSSGFIRVKIISLSGSFNKYRGKLNVVSGSRGE